MGQKREKVLFKKINFFNHFGGGRKIKDPEMENQLFDWCINEIKKKKKNIPRSLIRIKAKFFSNYQKTFKASKGWLEKFLKRKNYHEKVREILQEINNKF